MALPAYQKNKRRSTDFVKDQMAKGRHFRVMNIIHDFTRECVGKLADILICVAMRRALRYESP